MRLSLKTKTAYGIIAIADQCLYFMFGTFFLFFATTVVGLDPTIAGLIAAFGAIWDCICSAIIGHISDNVRSPFGKRRIFIMSAALPVAIFTVLLFTKIDADNTIKNIYYFLATILFWTGFSSFFIPFLAWGAELSEDYEERVKLRGFAYAGNTIGMAIGAVLPSLFVEKFMAAGNGAGQAWQLTAMFVGVVVFFSLTVGAYLVGNKSTVSDTSQMKHIKPEDGNSNINSIKNAAKDFISINKLFPFRMLVLAAIAYLAANTIFVADRLYYYTYNMGLDGHEITMLMAIEPFAGILFLPLLTKFSNKYDKRTLFVFGMTICSLSMIVLQFIGVKNFLEAIIMLIAFGLGAVCYWQMMPAMFYDICELDELVNGEQRQGSIVSLQAIAESMSEAVGLLLLGQMLKFAGFNGDSGVQSALALDWIKNGFLLIPGIFMLISAAIVYKYPITSKVFDKILVNVEEKRRGGNPWDIEEIRKICRIGDK